MWQETGEKFPYTHKVNGQFVESFATNQWIAPYNIWLLSKYNCHMCFDICTAAAIVKYIYKYINKGSDWIAAKIQCGGDEIEAYRNARYISAAEAAWRLLGFHVLERFPAVTALSSSTLIDRWTAFSIPLRTSTTTSNTLSATRRPAVEANSIATSSTTMSHRAHLTNMLHVCRPCLPTKVMSSTFVFFFIINPQDHSKNFRTLPEPWV